MRVGELARATGVSTDTIRFYEAHGLVTSLRRANGYRDFDPQMVVQVNLIRSAQAMGFSLAEIGELVRGMGDAGLDAGQVAQLLRDKIAEIDARMAGLAQLRATLAAQLDTVCPIRAQAMARAINA